MNAIIKFLQAARRMSQQGMTKEQIMDFAKREFGDVSTLLKRQIDNLFKAKPKVEKKGDVVPVKKKEGIEATTVTEELSDELTDSPLDDLKKITGGKTKDDILNEEMIKMAEKENTKLGIETLKNPKRPGGPLDPTTGITRTLARNILTKRGVEIGKQDPIDVFINTFGESITDVKNLAEEIIEAEQTGRRLKPVNELLEIEGLYDIPVPKNPNKGLTDKEMLDIAEEIERENILLNFDPTFRKPNAGAGMNKTDPSFQEYLRERGMIEKRQNMERLYKEYLEDMRRKKITRN